MIHGVLGDWLEAGGHQEGHSQVRAEHSVVRKD